jgi:hypothetical protein
MMPQWAKKRVVKRIEGKEEASEVKMTPVKKPLSKLPVENFPVKKLSVGKPEVQPKKVTFSDKSLAKAIDPPEAPDVTYKIKASDLIPILASRKLTTFDDFAELFTNLKIYEDLSVLSKPVPLNKELVEEHQTPPPFTKKIVKALFYIPPNANAKGRYLYLKVKLAPSSIKAAGTGAYAEDPIPKGARGVYKGIPRSEEEVNSYYSWTVKSHDPLTGKPDNEDQTIYYVDATELSTSNWTRYVNCGTTRKSNNFTTVQRYDKFFYVATRDIAAGEELFIDYGPDYRKDNLGMRGPY